MGWLRLVNYKLAWQEDMAGLWGRGESSYDQDGQSYHQNNIGSYSIITCLAERDEEQCISSLVVPIARLHHRYLHAGKRVQQGNVAEIRN